MTRCWAMLLGATVLSATAHAQPPAAFLQPPAAEEIPTPGASERSDATAEPPAPAPSAAPAPALSPRERSMLEAARRFGQFTPIGKVDIDVRLSEADSKSLPHLFSAHEDADQIEYTSPPFSRPWEHTILRPHARFCHWPLYFEEANLERYGMRRPLVQPAVSAAHFFGTIAVLPYKSRVQLPRQGVGTDYAYLPGVNGFEPQRRPLQFGPAAAQGAIMTGMFWGLPW
ncbi:MAG: hypothetical protein KDB14_10810 [Planctomycetales bacterium]|nr:hypothetical protein [Planctomycetales bacterium]